MGGLDIFGSPSPVSAPSSSATQSLTAEQVQMNRKKFTASILGACTPTYPSPQVFYEDSSLSILFTHEYRGSEGRLTLYYVNKAGVPLSNLTTNLTYSEGYLRHQMQPVGETLAPSPGGGAPSAQQQLVVECMRPVGEPAKFTVSYVNGFSGRMNATVDFPVLMTMFNEPLQWSAQDFMSRWDSLTAPGLEKMEMLSMIVPMDNVKGMLAGLRFGAVQGLPDDGGLTTYGAALLRTGTVQPNGEKISVGCLIKFEINPQYRAMRFTVRSVHAAATQSLVDAVKFAFTNAA